jgi:hypothetical protein
MLAVDSAGPKEELQILGKEAAMSREIACAKLAAIDPVLDGPRCNRKNGCCISDFVNTLQLESSFLEQALQQKAVVFLRAVLVHVSSKA